MMTLLILLILLMLLRVLLLLELLVSPGGIGRSSNWGTKSTLGLRRLLRRLSAPLSTKSSRPLLRFPTTMSFSSGIVTDFVSVMRLFSNIFLGAFLLV
jgi:hypothetical protein